MKWRRLYTVILGVSIGFLLGFIIFPHDNSTKKESSTYNVITTEKKVLSNIGTEVLPNVFDDGQSTVYIKVDKQWLGNGDMTVANIYAKEKNWELQFPTKKVVTWTIIPGVAKVHVNPFVAGLLIRYEQSPSNSSIQ